VEARAKPVKRERLFSGSQGKSWKSKELKRNVRRDDSSEWEHENECECLECVEPYATYGGPTECFQCNKCHIWGVGLCSGLCDFYVCSNFNAGDDTDDLTSEY
jgi:hypothetical protein